MRPNQTLLQAGPSKPSPKRPNQTLSLSLSPPLVHI